LQGQFGGIGDAFFQKCFSDHATIGGDSLFIQRKIDAGISQVHANITICPAFGSMIAPEVPVFIKEKGKAGRLTGRNFPNKFF
jgi:hypothetical protein